MNKKKYIKELRVRIDEIKVEILQVQKELTEMKQKSGTRGFTRNRLRYARLMGMWEVLYQLIKEIEGVR